MNTLLFCLVPTAYCVVLLVHNWTQNNGDTGQMECTLFNFINNGYSSFFDRFSVFIVNLNGLTIPSSRTVVPKSRVATHIWVASPFPRVAKTPRQIM